MTVLLAYYCSSTTFIKIEDRVRKTQALWGSSKTGNVTMKILYCVIDQTFNILNILIICAGPTNIKLDIFYIHDEKKCFV